MFTVIRSELGRAATEPFLGDAMRQGSLVVRESPKSEIWTRRRA